MSGTTEETIAEPVPAVRHWPAVDLAGVDFDPVLAELMREGPVTRVTLPNGEGWAWLVTRHDDVRMVANDPRFSREAVMDHPVTRLAPHFIPARGAVGFLDPPDHTRLRRSVAAAFTARGWNGSATSPGGCSTSWSTSCSRRARPPISPRRSSAPSPSRSSAS